MRILVIGAGGVGSAIAGIAARRDFFQRMVIADYTKDRAQAAADRLSDRRITAAGVDASDAAEVAALAREHRSTHVLNAVDPRFVLPVFNGAFAAGASYLDMAMSLSSPHPERPYELCGVKLGDEQFALAEVWEREGRLALVGMGVEPGLSDVFARYAADHLFAEIDELGTRDGADLVVDGYDFAPTFSIWTTIEECLNPPVIWTRDGVLKTLHKLGLDRTQEVTVGGAQVSPRDVVAACLPDPATLGERMHGRTCAGLLVTGTGMDDRPRSTYLYHVVDNEWSMREYGAQAVVWQTAVNAVVALELLATGAWSGAGVRGPESFDAVPFLDLLTEYRSSWGVREQVPG